MARESMGILGMSGFRLRLNAACRVEKVRGGHGMLAISSDVERMARLSAVAKRLTAFRDGPHAVVTV